MKVTVDAEIDLCFDVDTHHLVEALIKTVGKERAIEYIRSSEVKERGLVSMSDAEVELKRLRGEVREALDMVERGRFDHGLRALRLMCAPSVDESAYATFKLGKNPSYRPAA